MTALRFLQAFLVFGACYGFYYAFRWHRELEMTGKVVATTTCSLLALMSTQVAPLVWLTVAGTSVLGEITQLDCEHGTKHHVYFKYRASSVEIFGVASDAYGSKSCTSLQVGDTGAVVYVSAYPEVHVWGNPSLQLEELLLACAFVAIAAPMIFYPSIRRRLRSQP